MERAPIRVAVELNADGGAICGTVAVLDGQRQRFHGWLELAAALERARRAAGGEGSGSGSGSDEPLLST